MSSKLQLGITTIGDLLFKSSITYTFGNKSDGKSENPKNIELRIPNYQRPYKWTAKNVTQLLDDIIEAQ
jgi:uncharacterized protein with ParB-like and HNH nuclease domain